MPQRPLATSCCEHILLATNTPLLRHPAEISLLVMPKRDAACSACGQPILRFCTRRGANQMLDFAEGFLRTRNPPDNSGVNHPLRYGIKSNKELNPLG